MFASHRPLKFCEEWVVFLPGVSPGLYGTSDGMGPTSQPTILPSAHLSGNIPHQHSSSSYPHQLTSKSKIQSIWELNREQFNYVLSPREWIFLWKCVKLLLCSLFMALFPDKIFTKKDFFKFDKNVIFFECQSSEFASMRPSIRMRAYLLRS